MGIKKIILGEPVPDKDDPRYKEKHEKAVNAGKSFAHTIKLDKAAEHVQRFASNHSKLFLVLVFSFVLFSITLSLVRISNAVTYKERRETAIERQEKELHLNRHHQQIIREPKIQRERMQEIEQEIKEYNNVHDLSDMIDEYKKLEPAPTTNNHQPKTK